MEREVRGSQVRNGEQVFKTSGLVWVTKGPRVWGVLGCGGTWSCVLLSSCVQHKECGHLPHSQVPTHPFGEEALECSLEEGNSRPRIPSQAQTFIAEKVSPWMELEEAVRLGHWG